MRRPSRQINIFSISALDLFASAMGAFVIIAIILFPYYMKSDKVLAKELKSKKEELQQAKQTIATLEASKKEAESKADALQPKDIEVVFVCDTTGSMQDHIDGIKENLKDVVDILKILNKRTRVGFVAYKDISEQHHPGSYVTLTFPLTEMTPGAFSRLNDFVDHLTAYVVNNHELPESVSLGLEKAVNMPWNGGNTKQIIIVITDASAKDPQRALQLASQFNKSSPSSKITAILAQTENMDTEAPAFLKQLAEAGGGDYIRDSGRMLNNLIRAAISQ
jgi:NACalpha-BTF3-like transcription factor